jgi:hypothetical protein
MSTIERVDPPAGIGIGRPRCTAPMGCAAAPGPRPEPPLSSLETSISADSRGTDGRSFHWRSAAGCPAASGSPETSLADPDQPLADARGSDQSRDRNGAVPRWSTEASSFHPRSGADCPAASGSAPIWLAALIASGCRANAGGMDHAVRWNWVSGRALYTNGGTATERIEPLGVSLPAGGTLLVDWAPGRSEYRLKISGRGGRLAQAHPNGRGSVYAK